MKTLLTLAILVSLSGCANMPEVPEMKPIGIVPSLGKGFRCYLIDTENIIFKCDKRSVPMSELDLDGAFAFTDKDTAELIQWARDMKSYAQKHCK